MEEILIQILIEHDYSEYEAIGMLGKLLEEEAEDYVEYMKMFLKRIFS